MNHVLFATPGNFTRKNSFSHAFCVVSQSVNKQEWSSAYLDSQKPSTVLNSLSVSKKHKAGLTSSHGLIQCFVQCSALPQVLLQSLMINTAVAFISVSSPCVCREYLGLVT